MMMMMMMMMLMMMMMMTTTTDNNYKVHEFSTQKSWIYQTLPVGVIRAWREATRVLVCLRRTIAIGARAEQY
eukprot:5733123-Amphidinium_carterae.1